MPYRQSGVLPLALFAGLAVPCIAQLSAADTGAPIVRVSQAAGKWTLAGRRNVVEWNQADLSMVVRAGSAVWSMVPSSAQDLLIGKDGDEFHLRLADAKQIQVTSYATGFKTGIKIVLDGFRSAGEKSPGAPLDLRLVLTLCLEGADEELVAEATVIERGLVVRELNWPKEPDGRQVDFTVIPSDDGTLLPRDWPKSYHPIQRAMGDLSVIQSHLIESWAMSWWGFLKGDAAMIVIVETPDDAAYTFSHPAGGPTSMGPSWRAQLGRFGYLRSVRMGFLREGQLRRPVQAVSPLRRWIPDCSSRSKTRSPPGPW